MEGALAGAIKKALNRIIEVRGRGDHVFIEGTRTKLILMGLNPDRFTATSPDDPVTLQKVRKVAGELGVEL